MRMRVDFSQFGKTYLAGPMTGYDQHNFPAFSRAAEHLRQLGIDILSPMEMDLAEGVDPEEADWGECLRRDLAEIVAEVRTIIALPGWLTSKGAYLEVTTALQLGMPIYQYTEDDARPLIPLTNHGFPLVPDERPGIPDVARLLLWANTRV